MQNYMYGSVHAAQSNEYAWKILPGMEDYDKLFTEKRFFVVKFFVLKCKLINKIYVAFKIKDRMCGGNQQQIPPLDANY